MLLGTIIFVDSLLLLWSGYGFLDAYVLSARQERAMLAELSQPPQILQLHGAFDPTPLPVPLVVTLPGSAQDGKYDVLVKFLNPNPQWVARVRFRIIGDVVGAEQTVTLLNDDERFVLTPGIVRSAGSAPRLEVLDTRWERLRDPALFNERKPNFTVSDVTYQPAGDLAGRGTVPVNQVRFTAANESIHGFWAVPFMVILRQGSTELAAQEVTVDAFRSQERRNVALNFFGTIGSGATALVIPQVDVSDESVFMTVPGDPISF